MRRLARLEARAKAKETMRSFSMTIYFVDPEKRVRRTLLIEGDKQVWNSPEDEPATQASERIGGQQQ